MRYFFLVFLKGIWIGGTLSIPGVSGGSMAIVLGIYDRLICAVNSLFNDKEKRRESIGFLLVFSLGAMIGIIVLSGNVVWLLNQFPQIMVFLFAGLVAGGIPTLWREIRFVILKWHHIAFIFCGILIVFLISSLPPNMFALIENPGIYGIILQIIAGIIAAVAMVLPGISVSHMLYVLGIYESTMKAVATLQIITLIPAIIGGVVGVVLTTKTIGFFLKKYKISTYLVIVGFVLGSVVQLITSVESSSITLISPLFFAIGFIGMYYVIKRSEKRQKILI